MAPLTIEQLAKAQAEAEGFQQGPLPTLNAANLYVQDCLNNNPQIPGTPASKTPYYPSSETPNIQLSVDAQSSQLANNMVLLDAATSSVSINGSVISGVNFVNSSTVTFSVSGNSVSATSSGILQTASVLLTSAEILASTTVQVVAAPAAGQIIVPLWLEAHYYYGGTSYMLSSGTSNLSVVYAGLSTQLMSCATGFQSSGITSNQFSHSSTYLLSAAAGVAATSAEAKALNVEFLGTYNSGNGTILFVVWYYVVTF